MEIDVAACIEMLDRGESFAIATVLRTQGSAPRGPGAKMTIDAAGRTTGTVGGGMVEYMTIRTALKALAERRSSLSQFDLALGKEHSIGMICGGSVEVLIAIVDATAPQNKRLFKRVREYGERGIPASMVTVMECSQGTMNIGRALCRLDGLPDQSLPPWALQRLAEEKSLEGFRVITEEPERRIILDELESPTEVLIFGGGHVGMKLGELLHFVGLSHSVIDDREEMATPERHPWAKAVHAIPGYQGVFSQVQTGKNTLIIITTKSSANDQTVLAQSFGTEARYIGMIGSKTKIRTIFGDLAKAGVPRERLAQVRTPIGLEIGAETPAEIAVSIVGEIIQCLRAQGEAS